MNRTDKLKHNLILALKWLMISVVTGLVCGSFGALFSKAIAAVTLLRGRYFWLLYLLPVAGGLTVLCYRALRVKGVGTNHVFLSVHTEKKVSIWLAPAVFICSLLTHLCGGSAGREGAALQLGGGTSSLISRIFRLREEERKTLTLCSMAAFFSAIFGTPIGAFIFVLEVTRVERSRAFSALPTLYTSLVAFITAQWWGAHAERFTVDIIPYASLGVMIAVLVIAALGGFLAALFCRSLHAGEKLFHKIFKKDWLMALVGAVLIIALTLLVGTTDYNGGGIDVIERVFEGNVNNEAFLLKILFTVITVAAGYKGGEIVPTLFIGATFGGAAANVLGLPTGFGAALGMSALFSAATKCPMATLVLCIEMFGGRGAIYYAFAAVIAFLLSGKVGLYAQSFKVKEKQAVTI